MEGTPIELENIAEIVGKQQRVGGEALRQGGFETLTISHYVLWGNALFKPKLAGHRVESAALSNILAGRTEVANEEVIASGVKVEANLGMYARDRERVWRLTGGGPGAFWILGKKGEGPQDLMTCNAETSSVEQAGRAVTVTQAIPFHQLAHNGTCLGKALHIGCVDGLLEVVSLKTSSLQAAHVIGVPEMVIDQNWPTYFKVTDQMRPQTKPEHQGIVKSMYGEEALKHFRRKENDRSYDKLFEALDNALGVEGASPSILTGVVKLSKGSLQRAQDCSVLPDMCLKTKIRHPWIHDERGWKILEEMEFMEKAKLVQLKMYHSGGRALLIIPGDCTENFFSWPANDPRFHAWDPSQQTLEALGTLKLPDQDSTMSFQPGAEHEVLGDPAQQDLSSHGRKKRGAGSPTEGVSASSKQSKGHEEADGMHHD